MLTPELRQRIDTLLNSNSVVLFMKGSPSQPSCGFSSKASGILNELLGDYAHVDVLADPEIREGIKIYGQWPTIPQLYVKGELVGGSDIIDEMFNSGELHQVLGVPAPVRVTPTLHISPAAATAIRQAMENSEPGVALHLSVDARFQSQFQLKPLKGNEIVAEAEGIKVYFDLASAPRADGISIDWIEDVRGSGLAIDNPNAPAKVQSLSVQALKDDLQNYRVIDVRPQHARAIAEFPHPHDVLDEDSFEQLAALPKDTRMAFLCHHGNSSRQAAEHFRGLGFTQLFNVEGGIDAWAEQIDNSVSRY
ncbi:MAG: Grx4 family monothiol glutaredoxin [Arenimonas sp.]